MMACKARFADGGIEEALDPYRAPVSARQDAFLQQQI
jgi:hypothetical protein